MLTLCVLQGGVPENYAQMYLTFDAAQRAAVHTLTLEPTDPAAAAAPKGSSCVVM